MLDARHADAGPSIVACIICICFLAVGTGGCGWRRAGALGMWTSDGAASTFSVGRLRNVLTSIKIIIIAHFLSSMLVFLFEA